MPTYNKPIPTLITENVFETLLGVQLTGPFNVALKVERLNEENHEFNNPEHLKAIVDPGDPQKQTGQSAGLDEWIRTYIIHVWLMPSQLDKVSIDETCDLVIANVTRALCFDDGAVNPPTYRRGGYAIDTWAEDATTAGPLPNSLAYLIGIPVSVRYTTIERDLYSQD